MMLKLRAWLDTLDILKCQLREETGLYCPGCGGTRAVLSLLEGHILDSIKYNPIIVYALLVLLIYGLLKFKKVTIKQETRYIVVTIIFGFLLVISRTIFLDYYVICKGIHLI